MCSERPPQHSGSPRGPVAGVIARLQTMWRSSSVYCRLHTAAAGFSLLGLIERPLHEQLKIGKRANGLFVLSDAMNGHK